MKFLESWSSSLEEFCRSIDWERYARIGESEVFKSRRCFVVLHRGSVDALRKALFLLIFCWFELNDRVRKRSSGVLREASKTVASFPSPNPPSSFQSSNFQIVQVCAILDWSIIRTLHEEYAQIDSMFHLYQWWIHFIRLSLQYKSTSNKWFDLHDMNFIV